MLTLAGTFLILNSRSLGPNGGPCLNSGFPNSRYTTRKPRMFDVSESHLITMRLSSLYASRTITSSTDVEATPSEFEDCLGSWAPLTAYLPPPAINGFWLRSSSPPSTSELLLGAALFLSDAAAIRPPWGSCFFEMVESVFKGLLITDEISIGLFCLRGVEEEDDDAPNTLLLQK